VKERESEINALNTELSSLREREERKNEDIASLEGLITANGTDYHKNLAHIQGKLDRMALERNEALHSLHVSQLQIDLQCKTIEQLESCISHKKENDGALMATVLQLEEKLRKANVENQKKINVFKVEDKDKANLIETLKDEVKMKQQLIDTICAEREASLKDIDELQNALAKEKNALNMKESELQAALDHDVKLKEGLNLLQSQFQDSRYEVSELERALEDAESNCRSLTSSANNLSEKVLQLEGQLQSSSDEIKELTLLLSEKEMNHQSLESIVTDLQLRENESNDKLLKLETLLHASENNSKQLKQALKMKSIEFNDTMNQLNRSMAHQDELTLKNQKLEAQIEEYRFEISELEKVLDENNDDIEALRSRERVLQENLRKLDSQMVITRNDLEDLQKHSDQNNLSIKLNLVDEMKHLKDSLSVLTREKADSINILNEREIKLKELSISNQALMKENAELLESVNGFKSDLSMKESEIEQLEEVIVQQKHEMRNIRSDQSSTLNSLKESEIMTLQLEKELDAVKSAVEAERRKIIEVTKSNQILKESSESKKREIDDLLDTIEQFEVHVYELKESNESKQQEIDDLLDTVEQLDVHIQELTKSYDALKNTSREEAAAAKIHFEFEQKRSHQEVEEIKYAFQAQISSTREELKAALSEIQTLKDHSIKLETKLQDTETAFARQKESADTLTRTFEDDITEKQRHISNLNEELNIAQEKQLSSTMALSQKENELQETLKILDDIKNVSHSNETNLENLKKEIEKCCLDLNLIDEKRHPSSTLDFLCLLKNAVVDYKANAIAGFETANTRESAVNRLERMLAAKENEFDTLKNDNLALIHQLRESKEDLQQKFSDISMKEDKISELESAISQLELDFDMSEQLIEELRSEKEDIIKQLKKIEKESEVMTKSFTSASETIKELERKSVDSHRIHNSVLEEKNAHIQRLQHDIHSATIKAENLISAKEKLQSDILQLKQSYSQLELESQERFIAVQEELRDQIRRNDELHEDNCVLMSKLEDSLNSLEDLRACVALNEEEFSASIRNREAEIADLKKAMSALEDEANSKAERISELQNIERELSDEISKRTKIIRETEESKERIIISSKAEIEALNTQIKDLKSILSDDKAKDAKIDSLKATISSLNDEIKIKKSNIDSISKSRDSEVEILRKQIDTLHVKIQESQVEIQDHQFEKNLLQDSISSLQSDFQMKTQEITLLSQKYDTDVTSLQQELDDKSSQILCLSQKFDLIERTSQDLKSELDEALAKQQEFQIINADIEKAMQEATGLLKLRDETVLELRTENKHLEQKIGTLNGLPEKLEAKDTTISKISLEVQNLRAQHEELLKEIEHLKTALSSKDMDMIALNERAMKLETDLKTAENAVLCTAKENVNGTEEYRLKIRELEDSYQDVSARLKGAEKIAMIQNKECTRLLNEIDSKTEQIIDLTKQLNSIETEREDYASRLSEIDSCMRAQKDLLTQMVKERDEHLSRISELELRFTSQKDLFLELEKELQYKDQKIEKLESRRDSRMPSNAKIVELEEELARCNLQIYDLQTEVNQAHDECEELRSAIEKANAESATSEEEVQLLCESIEEKERLLNSLRLQLSSFAEEKQELQSHLNTVQIHLEKDSFSPLSTNSVDTKDVDEGQTSNFLSPSNSEVLSKHNELLDDLHRMKELIKDAISTPASNSSNSMPSPNQNQLLSSMEDQVDVLMKDIVDLKRNLSEKERLIHDLTMSLERSEKEKKEIETKLLNRKNYIKQLENALSHEVKHRRAAEEALLSTEAEKGNLALENEKQSEELQCAKLEIKAKSDAVQEQMKVARQMAKQLQITKKKIFALKKHLIENGLILPPEDIVSPTIESTKSYENSESNYSPIVTDLETRLNTVIPTTPPHDYSPIVTDENFRARAMDKTPIASNYTFSPIMTKTDISNDSLNWDALSSEDDEEHSY
jgi:chromosome segregation ATPase